MLVTRGVTLMELIVVMAVIAILSTIAYPNYLILKQESRRADAQASVIATEGIVQRYLTENNKATLDSNDMALTQFANYSPSSGTAVISNGGDYIITIVTGSNSYTINATATKNGVSGDCFGTSQNQCGDITCRVISIAAGAKQSTDSTGSVADAATTTCW